MKGLFFFLLVSVVLGSFASRIQKTNESKHHGVVFNQIYSAELSGEAEKVLKKEFDILRKELAKMMNTNSTKGILMEVVSLKKQMDTLRKELTQRLDDIRGKDPWRKLNTSPVCFGARGNQFGRFVIPTSGQLAAVKLVHLSGFVSCDTGTSSHWSYWGCGVLADSVKDQVNVAITTSSNRILLPPSQFITSGTKWSKIPGYNSVSPELVLTEISTPIAVSPNQELRLWYGEDLADLSESDNGGKSCCDVYAHFT